MPVIQLIAVLVVIGVILWAINYLGKDYIDPTILTIINKVAIVAVVLWICFWLLSIAGVVGPMDWGGRRQVL